MDRASAYQEHYKTALTLDKDRLIHRIKCGQGVIKSKGDGWEVQQIAVEAYKQALRDAGIDIDHLEDEQEINYYENAPFDYVVARRYARTYENAIRRGKEFNLSMADIRLLMLRKTCTYTGVRFTLSGDTMRTFDRLDPSKGYVKGNVYAVTDYANQLKNSLFELGDHDVKTVFRLMRSLTRLGFK